MGNFSWVSASIMRFSAHRWVDSLGLISCDPLARFSHLTLALQKVGPMALLPMLEFEAQRKPETTE